MKTVLFICNTHYQLIVGLQMRLTTFSEDNCYLLITNCSKGTKGVAERLKNQKVFKDVYYQEVYGLNEKSTLKHKWFYLKGAIFGNKKYKLSAGVSFDEIISFNFDLHSHIIFANEYKKNKNVKCEKMEEGLLSYSTKDTTCGILNFAYKVRKFLRLKNLKTTIGKFYCFSPLAYKGNLEAIKIPKILVNDKKLKEILTSIYENESKREYKEKYIYLPCVYDFEGGEAIGELELAVELANAVGKENLLVKVHPRDDVSRYISAGLTVDKNSSIPWEVIQINNDFEDKVLLSTLSTSLLTTALLFENSPSCYYLYSKCNLDKNDLAKYYKNILENYLKDANRLGLKNVYIANSFEDIIKKD